MRLDIRVYEAAGFAGFLGFNGLEALSDLPLKIRIAG
jgi:hypothetical protein